MTKKRGYTIAMAGKGGTGKTTLAGLLVRFLKEHDLTPILAVDADSNSNLHEVLGIKRRIGMADGDQCYFDRRLTAHPWTHRP